MKKELSINDITSALEVELINPEFNTLYESVNSNNIKHIIQEHINYINNSGIILYQDYNGYFCEKDGTICRNKSFIAVFHGLTFLNDDY